VLEFYDGRITNFIRYEPFLPQICRVPFFSLATQLTLTIGGSIQKDDLVLRAELQYFFR